MKPLIEVDSFGAIDADNDALLLETFADHEAYQSLLDRSRFLVVGKKGAGKTAIFKKLLTLHDYNTFTFGHTFSDYPWHYHEQQARTGIPDFDKFTHSWKYLILLTLSKILLNQDQSIPFDDRSVEAGARIEKFVTDTYGSRDPDVTQIFLPTKMLRLKPSFEVDLSVLKAGISPESVPMEELPTIVAEVNRNLLLYSLDCLNPEHDYYICFDQLDLGFNSENPDYTNRLIGLLLAARDINIAAREVGKTLLVAVFLRDDIYDTLHFEDKNKITENFVANIEWDTPRTDKSLRQLMENRFNTVLGEDGESIHWEDVFDESQEMPGRQTKYQHLLDRTYLRPRDMIKFVNVILGQYKIRRRGESEDAGRFENPDLHTARPEYSEYLLAELDDEVYKHLPGYQRYLDLIRSIGGWQFEKGRFETVADERPELTESESADHILERLYFFSLVGFYRAGGRGYGGSEYVFRYKEPKTRFDGTASRYRVHPGLVEVLGLKKVTVQASGAENDDDE